MLLTHRFAFYPPATASASRGFLQARSCSSVCLAAGRDCTTRDASEPTSATQHVFDYEHPRLVDSQCLVTRLSSRADWGIERFTTPNSLRRAVRLCFVGGRFLPQSFPGFQRVKNWPTSRPTVPLAPLSPPRLLPMGGVVSPHARVVIRAAKIALTACP